MQGGYIFDTVHGQYNGEKDAPLPDKSRKNCIAIFRYAVSLNWKYLKPSGVQHNGSISSGDWNNIIFSLSKT